MKTSLWISDVIENMTLVNDANNNLQKLKDLMERYLKSYFDFDDVEWKDDMTEVTLKWGYENDPYISIGTFSQVDMKFKVTHGYDDRLGRGVWIILYPFTSLGEEIEGEF